MTLAGKDEGNGPERKLLPAAKYSRSTIPAKSEDGIIPVNELSIRERNHRLGMVSPQELGMDPVNALLSKNMVEMLDRKVAKRGPVNKLL